MAKEPKAKEATKAPKAKPASKDKAPAASGIHKPVTPSADLAAIIGEGDRPRSEVVSAIWDYIRKNDLQNPKDKREILADDKLEKIFGKKKATMFEMNKFLAQHLK
ncbi:SWIB/MDM2 domain-containing protein [Sphingomonas jatrophae]|uniref:SWIB/MDM2 domain-containing protein n=1 Tax=Sphingomonas jatrophae TaxID=1166337 RepID=A0A1I6M2X3_9SPHN|nr:SWIB/MDM2 domain-containing protein [Sphingomonas jatrophae]SFS10014.1 SWIB/MDM2 domain-containing protein [Sphingomonas jatrophae]